MGERLRAGDVRGTGGYGLCERERSRGDLPGEIGEHVDVFRERAASAHRV